jgi:phosphate/sulfate permease
LLGFAALDASSPIPISILLAWVLTLPVCIFLGASLFSLGLYLTLHVFGVS